MILGTNTLTGFGFNHWMFPIYESQPNTDMDQNGALIITNRAALASTCPTTVRAGTGWCQACVQIRFSLGCVQDDARIHAEQQTPVSGGYLQGYQPVLFHCWWILPKIKRSRQTPAGCLGEEKCLKMKVVPSQNETKSERVHGNDRVNVTWGNVNASSQSVQHDMLERTGHMGHQEGVSLSVVRNSAFLV